VSAITAPSPIGGAPHRETVTAGRGSRQDPGRVIHPVGVMTPSRRLLTLARMSTASEVPQIGRNWWLFLILGLVSLCAGILAIVYPGITLLALGIFIGVSLMLVGAMEIVEAIAGSAESRALSAITGVLAMLAGLVCLRRPGESLLALVIVLGFYLVVTGVIRFVRSFSSREDRVLLIALAILDIVLGILILSLPKLSLVTLAVLFAISLLARGLFAVVVAFKLRGASHHGQEPGAAATA
jgi:uncharacterized membrane protein HdeD (DUF308 family)